MYAAPFIDQVLLSAQSVDETASVGVDLRGARDPVVYIKSSAGVASGVVSIEEADDVGYTGTWSLIQDVTAPPASTTTAVHLPGSYNALRVRISTVIAGGTITARVSAGGD